MSATVLLTGDVNLMNVTDATVPFRRVREAFAEVDLVIANLECCLYSEGTVALEGEGFFADPVVGGDALKTAGIAVVGVANNVNYGTQPILQSLFKLDELGIAHAGGGVDAAAARAPVIIERNGTRIAFLQRSAVYWPTNHEALEDAPGIAVTRAHTAYQVPMHRARPGIPPMNRPGIPPTVLTWVDKPYLKALQDDVAAARANADVVIVGCHWGLGREVLDYMAEMAHAAVDAGASAVVGHGPHYSLPVEVYRDAPVFYGLGSFSFHTGHRGKKHPDWLGMMPRLTLEDGRVTDASFRYVRHNDANETYMPDLAREETNLAELAELSQPYGTRFEPRGDAVAVALS